MKNINKDELYEHFSQFLKTKGIEMKDGSYTQVVQRGCSIMADAVNLTQQGVERAKTEIDKRLDKMRQVIHERTAPKPPPKPASAKPASKSTPSAAAKTATLKQQPRTSAKTGARKSGKKNKSKM
jgi:hypothetical protein